MWRHDASRSAATTEQLPDQLHRQWTRTWGPRKPAWDDTLNRDLMTYDRLLEPVVRQGRMFLGLNDRDQVVAVDLATGEIVWTFFASAPVRLPPVAYQDLVFATSDDGYLYCLRASDGKLSWSFRGGPSPRLILGNQRLISAWPARGGAVVRDGIVYFTASIWPFMGTFLYALRADSGEVVWVNDESGAQYVKQPHSAPSFAGVAPQGSLVATQDLLLVPGGRSIPAAFERATGKLRYFEPNSGGKGSGGSFLAANEQSWFVHTRVRGTREFGLQDGIKTAFMPNEPVLAGPEIYSAELVGTQPLLRAVAREDKRTLWEFPADGLGDLILAGNTLYAAGRPTGDSKDVRQTRLSAIRLPDHGQAPREIWHTDVPGTVERLLAADGRLVAVTLEGNVHVLGAQPRSVAELREPRVALSPAAAELAWAEAVRQPGGSEGYAILVGAAEEDRVLALASQSSFVELAVVDEDPVRVERLRRRLDTAGRYGAVTVRAAALTEFQPPPYIAHLVMISREMASRVVGDPALLRRLYDTVRPYGGAFHVLADEAERAAVRASLTSAALEQAEISVTSVGVVVRRQGPLPGAGTWTHQYGNVANTVKSDDRRVRLPLGVLWFGGVSHEDVLPRHGHGPPEQVVGGRLFIQGMNSLTARDVYTGRILWQRKFENLGTYDVYFDETYKETPLDTAYNQVHIPGANARGANYVVTDDRVYILEGDRCHLLDPATGRELGEIRLPQEEGQGTREWGFLGVYNNVLIGGVGFANYRTRHDLEVGADATLSKSKAGFGSKSLDRAASEALIGFDRHSGQVLWKVAARHSFWHNGIVAGSGKVFAIDRNPKPVEEFLRRRGKSDPASYRLVAWDVQTGKLQWELPGGVMGTWLGYSAEHDLLLQAGSAASDRLSSEVSQGMAVYRGRTGEVVWRKDDLKYSGPCVLHRDLIFTNANSYAESAGAFRITDGAQKMIENPVTGELQPWKITRAYGCNTIIGSENMLTFRSGAAGFYDLLTEGGTGNFGGFRSGCTANLIAADGVLNAPDYTRTCSCSYQNQTSLALVNMPEMDAWTVNNSATIERTQGRIRRLGLNFGAPGDRRDPQGLLWLEMPAVAGESPELDLQLAGDLKYYQDHPSSQPSAALPWVASSGVAGITSLRLRLQTLPPPAKPAETKKAKANDDCGAEERQRFRVRLHVGLPRTAGNEPRTLRFTIAGHPETQSMVLGGTAGRAHTVSFEEVLLGDVLELAVVSEGGETLLSGLELQQTGE